ncbi:MAG: alpha/beta hydrolase, partial [Chloroflexaceae bacterium]|nr:alpha/beta hydrolase [Chloroflexaceae bacterium]
MTTLAHRYAQVCAAYPVQRRTLHGHCWQYLDIVQGDETLLLLPGGFGEAATSFQYMLAFAPRFRVLSLSYPPTIATVQGLLAGIVSLLDELHITQVHVLGGSASGLIAQCLVRQHPQRVASLILSHTGLPRSARASQSEACAALVGALPLPPLKLLLRLSCYAFLPRRNETHAFWRRHFAAMIKAATRESLVNRFRIAADVDRHYRFVAGDLHGWPGRVCIIQALHDGWLSQAEQ